MSLLDDLLEDYVALPEGVRAEAEALIDEDDLSFDALPGPQTDAYLSKADILLYGGAAGGGKALDVTTPIPTPFGWTLMGMLDVGDVVFDERGEPCNVVAKSEVHFEDTYRVTFSDGSEIVAGGNHQWVTRTVFERERALRSSEEWKAKRRASRPSRGLGKRPDLALRNSQSARSQDLPLQGIRTTREIAETLRDGVRANHCIDVAAPLALPETALIVEPYTLGAWLGDGTAVNGQITGIDECVFARVANSYPVTRHANPVSRGTIGLKVDLRSIGVLGNKHIPPAYLRASKDQRLALLQGLMDTDGYCDQRGQCEISLTSKRLIEDVLELLGSLGIKAQIREGLAKLKGRMISQKWRIKFLTDLPAFSMPRKLLRQKRGGFKGTHSVRYIENVERIDPVPLQCIEVDSPSHMYLAGKSFIPTHNSYLAMGLAAQEHQHSIVFRRESSQTDGLEKAGKAIIGNSAKFNGTDKEWTWPDGRTCKLAGLQLPDDWMKHAGRERDLMVFDEAGEFLRMQVASLRGWLRGPEGQRCRMLLASNPPRSSDGYWMTEWFAPWIDAQFPNPAKPGELRWGILDSEGVVHWTDGPEPVSFENEIRDPVSFTFIPAKLADNPYRNTAEYRKTIDSLPEPLRSQLKYGDFAAGMQDGLDQAIPTEWVRKAQDRWTETRPLNVPMCAMGVDVAQGGSDQTTIAIRYDGWYMPLDAIPGSETPSGAEVAGRVLARRHDNAVVVVDLGGGWGGDALKHLALNSVEAMGYMGVKESMKRTRDQQLRFANIRTEAYWRFREALDPHQIEGSPIALPNDAELRADLTAPTFEIKAGKGGMVVHLEPKDKLVKRIGRSPDKGDAVVMAWWAGPKAVTDMVEWEKSAPRKFGSRGQAIMGHQAARRR